MSVIFWEIKVGGINFLNLNGTIFSAQFRTDGSKVILWGGTGAWNEAHHANHRNCQNVTQISKQSDKFKEM